MHLLARSNRIFVQQNTYFVEFEILGLVRFVDNWPWTSIVHGQNFFLLFHGHCPQYMGIGHKTWTLAMIHGHCPQYMDIVHDTWTILIVKISNFIESEDLTLEFSTEYSKNDRVIIHELAEKFNLKHHSVGKSPNRHIIIGKIGSIIGLSNKRKKIQAETEICTQPIIPYHPKISEIVNDPASQTKRVLR
jgi:hypothetical protein